MDKLKMMDTIKRVYGSGGNIISYLRDMEGRDSNTLEDILISYDFQAGTYNAAYKAAPEKYQQLHDMYAEIICDYLPETGYSLCEAGVGEATTFFPILERLKPKPEKAYGLDISWSRIAEAILFEQYFPSVSDINKRLVVGDLFETPFADNSIDIVYTVHALEPNGGRERELLAELFRITSDCLILFEPIYEFASDEAKKRMDFHGYVKNLKKCAEELGYAVVRYEALNYCLNPLNPTGVMVIKKSFASRQTGLCDPISKQTLREFMDCLFCPDSMLSYPKINGIPCLTRQSAILTTKFNDECK